jgi:hypothetical protein
MGLCTDVDGVVLGLILGILHHIPEAQNMSEVKGVCDLPANPMLGSMHAAKVWPTACPHGSQNRG